MKFNGKRFAIAAVSLALSLTLVLAAALYSSSDSKVETVNNYRSMNDSNNQSKVSSVITTTLRDNVSTNTDLVPLPEADPGGDPAPEPEPDPEPTPEPIEGEVILPMQNIIQLDTTNNFNTRAYGHPVSGTIGQYGCYLCSLFMCASTLNGDATTPHMYSLDTVSDYAKDETYMAGSAVRGPSVASSLGYSLSCARTTEYNKITDSEAFFNVVKTEIDAGRPLLFRICGSWPTYHPRNSEHSTAIRGYGENESGKYVIFNDPSYSNGCTRRIPLSAINCANVTGRSGGWLGYCTVSK